MSGALERTAFPGVRRDEHRFDGPGGTLVHGTVAQAIAGYLAGPSVANDHGAFPQSAQSDAVAEQAADAFRRLVRGPAGDVLFGHNMTQLTTTFVRAISGGLRSGDEIVCTALDHEANVYPWRAAAAACGAAVRTAPVDADGVLRTNAVTDLIGPRTRWVAITAASNALGTVPDLAPVVAAAHAVGARVYVDGVQAIAHLPFDVSAVGCDALVTSPYKWYGPHCGALWLAPGLAEEARLPEQVPSAGSQSPGRLSLGTTNFESLVGLAAAAEVLLAADRTAVARREGALLAAAAEQLAAIPSVRLFGPPVAPPSGPATDVPRVPVLALRVRDRPAQQVAAALAARGVSVWDGSFYASAAVAAVSPDEPDLVRVGIAAYTDEVDVEALVAGVRAIAAA
ncbi:cysteine desulfurase family protein, VC1184 subfamily [Jatrophihabitans endophyticus]|uniref:Cysteine desulfurase family protein, VC1184 subfamily n=1 Tax=Jatrophihabitans endophyticus TaxID=1206085 RepID=A0A1M5CRU5_9ACTN|nr:aminotransferase class V-fold PLP-dependent enzyme [Jatrophihabitans endophyticus]SHF57416.1 cysteine desulfurase family protein, VC1184 subfamily [Jatrophihabitans endophyticus]